MKGHFIESKTWIEVEELIQSVKTLVVPIGARIKEHGYHLPINNDWILAEYLTKRVAEEVEALFIPTLQYGFYPAFVEYPGSVQIEKETFKNYVKDICRSFSRHGIEKCYFLNTGVSTNWSLEPARLELAKESVTMEYSDILEALAPIEKEIMQQSQGTHADEIETSMMMYISPEIVQMEKATKVIPHERTKGPFRRKKGKPGLYSPSGVYGDATLATYEKGKYVVEKFVPALIQDIQTFQSKKYTPPAAREKYLD